MMGPSFLRLLPFVFCVLGVACWPATAQPEPLFEFATIDVFENPALQIPTEQSWGVSFADYNNDGYPDLFFTETGGRINLFENEGGRRFTSRGFNIQVDKARLGKWSGAVWGDYDNDGDLDLHVPIPGGRATGSPQPMMLQENERGILRVVSKAVGLDARVPLRQSVWLDYDNDGYIDLYVSPAGASRTYGPPQDTPSPELRNRLYRNNGDKTFSDVTQEAGLDVQMSPYSGGSEGSGMLATDLDGDGWIDLCVPSEEGPTRLFFNNGQGGFVQGPIADDLKNIDRPTGIARGDIDNDGDMDLFIASGGTSPAQVLDFRAQLLLNLGDGQFVDVTEGVGLGALNELPTIVPTMGDVDNDGDLDITVSGGSNLIPPQHLLFLNNGQGVFEDANEGSGVVGLPILGRAFGDYNGDGFLDLVFGQTGPDPVDLFPPEQYPHLYRKYALGPVGDCLGCRHPKPNYPLYRGVPNGNHWLRVELAGRQSNRSAIGARVFALANGVRQMREIGGGNGFGQNEMVAHFGLGASERVEQVEVRWPSGQVEVFEGIAADQKIRIIEGSGAYHAVRPTHWQHGLPDEADVGAFLTADLRVEPALYEPAAQVLRVTADLSAFGDGAAVPLADAGGGRWTLTQNLSVEGVPGVRELSVLIEQETSLGPYWTRLSKTVAVQDKAGGFLLFGDGPAPGWSLVGEGEARVDPETTERVHSGSSAQALTIGDDAAVYRLETSEVSEGDWLYPSQQPGIDLQPFTHLSFWLYTDQARIESLYVDIAHGAVVIPFWGPEKVRTRTSLTGTLKTLLPDVHALLWEVEDDLERLDLLVARNEERGMWDVGNRYLDLDLSGEEWVAVHVPLDSLIGFEEDLPLSEVRISGKVEGTIYVDELRLTNNPEQPATAVLEGYSNTAPAIFSLEQNYPNPFNSGTVIPFALPAAGAVELAVYNLTGQKVVTLVEGERAAGSYKITWDSRDAAGRALATGMYLYELRQSGQLVQTRKLLLLR